jgi:hypothetical protein
METVDSPTELHPKLQNQGTNTLPAGTYFRVSSCLFRIMAMRPRMRIFEHPRLYLLELASAHDIFSLVFRHRMGVDGFRYKILLLLVP